MRKTLDITITSGSLGFSDVLVSLVQYVTAHLCLETTPQCYGVMSVSEPKGPLCLWSKLPNVEYRQTASQSSLLPLAHKAWKSTKGKTDRNTCTAKKKKCRENDRHSMIHHTNARWKMFWDPCISEDTTLSKTEHSNKVREMAIIPNQAISFSRSR